MEELRIRDTVAVNNTSGILKSLLNFVVCLIFLAGLLSPLYGQWIKHTVDEQIFGADGVFVADVDDDGDLDILATGFDDCVVVWYEAPSWNKHYIDSYLLGARNVWAADLDGDSYLDVVATGYDAGQVVWYKGPIWLKDTIDNIHNGAWALYLADLNKDDTLDVIATSGGSLGDNNVVWYEAPGWHKQLVDSQQDSRDVCVDDINGDSLLDIVATGFYSSEVAWYEAPYWDKHIIDSRLSGAEGVCTYDINGDNIIDVVAAGFYEGEICWYEAPYWNKHSIDKTIISPRRLYIGDIDRDNDADVVAAGFGSNHVVWYENQSLSWVKHIIDDSLNGAADVYVADIDSDNDLDVVATGYYANSVIWYENVVKIEENPSVNCSSFEYLVSKPNPFTKAVVIECRLPLSGYITFDIFNTAGEKIWTLVDEYKSGEVKTLVWDGKTISGRAAPLGVYFLMLNAITTEEGEEKALTKVLKLIKMR